MFSGGACVSAEIIDLAAGTISLEANGTVTSSRPLTPDEVARYAPPVPAPTPEERLAAARQALAALDALPSPVLTADVVDVLDDLRGVL